MTGMQVIQLLLAPPDGESLLVNGVEWRSLGETFAITVEKLGKPVPDGDDVLFVARADPDDYFEADAEYEVIG